jgi:hypothetical protein
MALSPRTADTPGEGWTVEHSEQVGRKLLFPSQYTGLRSVFMLKEPTWEEDPQWYIHPSPDIQLG